MKEETTVCLQSWLWQNGGKGVRGVQLVEEGGNCICKKFFLYGGRGREGKKKIRRLLWCLRFGDCQRQGMAGEWMSGN